MIARIVALVVKHHKPVLGTLPRTDSSAGVVQVWWSMAVSQVMTQDATKPRHFTQVVLEIHAIKNCSLVWPISR